MLTIVAENYGKEEQMNNKGGGHGSVDEGGGLIQFLPVSRYGYSKGTAVVVVGT